MGVVIVLVEKKRKGLLSHTSRALAAYRYIIYYIKERKRERERINNTLDKPLIAFVIYTSIYIYIVNFTVIVR